MLSSGFWASVSRPVSHAVGGAVFLLAFMLWQDSAPVETDTSGQGRRKAGGGGKGLLSSLFFARSSAHG